MCILDIMPAIQGVLFHSIYLRWRYLFLAWGLAALILFPIRSFGVSWQAKAGFNSSPERREGYGWKVIPSGDGKYFVGGYFSSWNGTPRYSLVKIDSSGQVDSGFSPAAIDFIVFTLALQGDGKLLVGGRINKAGGQERTNLLRLNPDGTLDESFAPSGFYFTMALAQQTDRKILVGGDRGLMRLNADGTADTGYIKGTGFNDYVTSICVQADGKAIVGGYFTSYNGTPCNRIARLNADGTLDETFLVGDGFNDRVDALAMRPDGTIAAAGSFTTYQGTQRKYAARINVNGSLDPGFDPSSSLKGICFSIAVSGQYTYVGGAGNLSATRGNKLARLDSTGALDPTFEANFPTMSYWGVIQGIAVTPSGRVVLVGSFGGWGSGEFSATYSGMTAVESDGTVVPGVAPLICTPGTVHVIQAEAGGKFLIGGEFTHVNGKWANRLARLNPDGSLDESYNVGGSGAAIDWVSALARQTDGKTVIGGMFYTYNGVQRQRVARVLENGVLDAGFDPNAALAGLSQCQALALQADGKILVAGFGTQDNWLVPFLRRLNPDGALDAGFMGNTAFQNITGASIGSVAIDGAGRIYVGGSFPSYQGIARKNLVRLNSDGSLDSTFDAGDLGGQVLSIAIRSDGRIWITGSDGLSCLLADGSKDTSFQPRSGWLTKVLELDNQKLLALGDNYYGDPNIVMLLGNGSIDSTFKTRNLGNLRCIDGLRLSDNSVLVASDISLMAAGTQTLMLVAEQADPEPVFTTQPESQRVNIGETVTFVTATSGSPAPSYQWKLNGVIIPGATGASLTLDRVHSSDAGIYTVVATNSAGTATSDPASLSILSQHTDFDGDGFAEPLWRNSLTGEIRSWLTAGGSRGFGAEGGNWSVINNGTGDFDADGLAEPLWRNSSTGEVRSWLTAGGSLGFGREGGWAVIDNGTGDYDGDGLAEPLWHNAITGEIRTWLAAGGSVGFGSEGGGWSAIGTGDFDGDGLAEPLWRDSITGDIHVWFMGGDSLTFGREGGGWSVIDNGTGDFDGDGWSEPLWRNAVTGEIRSWFLGGGSRGFGSEGGGWSVIQVGDYDGDGYAEPLWRNAITGEIRSWLAAGGSVGFGSEGGGWSVVN